MKKQLIILLAITAFTETVNVTIPSNIISNFFIISIKTRKEILLDNQTLMSTLNALNKEDYQFN